MPNTKLPHILVITGPTASGKSSLALTLAKKIPAEIISADSRQIYKYLDIGTAKPTPEERNAVPHHCIDIRTPDQRFNAGDFQIAGRKAIADIGKSKKLPIIVGGTGLYIRALVDGFFEQPVFSGKIRSELEDRLVNDGKESLYEELRTVDPESAERMDASKQRRVIRALEVFYETGITISEYHRHHTVEHMYDASFVGLQWDRKKLYERINDRVDRMREQGLVEEVRRLLERGFDDRLQALQTVGYKEAISHLRGEIAFDRMVELIKQNTRRFAKRQITWFRKEPRIEWFDISDDKQGDSIADKISSSLK